APAPPPATTPLDEKPSLVEEKLTQLVKAEEQVLKKIEEVILFVEETSKRADMRADRDAAEERPERDEIYSTAPKDEPDAIATRAREIEDIISQIAETTDADVPHARYVEAVKTVEHSSPTEREWKEFLPIEEKETTLTVQELKEVYTERLKKEIRLKDIEILESQILDYATETGDKTIMHKEMPHVQTLKEELEKEIKLKRDDTLTPEIEKDIEISEKSIMHEEMEHVRQKEHLTEVREITFTKKITKEPTLLTKTKPQPTKHLTKQIITAP
ncbi:Uncharacterized protein GBIM_22106, partial [Gryllus bimaculatus]